MFDNYPDPTKAKKQEQAYRPQQLSTVWPLAFAAILSFIVLLIVGHSHDPHLPQAVPLVLITATPSPAPQPTAPTIVEERLDLTPLHGAGEIVFVRVPTHYITAVGISYPHGDTITQQTICDPIPHDGVCQFPRPVLSVLEARAFSLMVRDANNWHYLPANVSHNVLTVVWGHQNGTYRYFLEN